MQIEEIDKGLQKCLIGILFCWISLPILIILGFKLNEQNTANAQQVKSETQVESVIESVDDKRYATELLRITKEYLDGKITSTTAESRAKTLLVDEGILTEDRRFTLVDVDKIDPIDRTTNKNSEEFELKKKCYDLYMELYLKTIGYGRVSTIQYEYEKLWWISPNEELNEAIFGEHKETQ